MTCSPDAVQEKREARSASDIKTLHTESRVARLFEIKVVRRGPVTLNVIRLTT